MDSPSPTLGVVSESNDSAATVRRPTLSKSNLHTKPRRGQMVSPTTLFCVGLSLLQIAFQPQLAKAEGRLGILRHNEAGSSLTPTRQRPDIDLDSFAPLRSRKQLRYGEYVVRLDGHPGKRKEDSLWQVLLFRNRQQIARHPDPSFVPEGRLIRFGLTHILSKDSTQLIIDSFNGGNAGCRGCWIYDLKPEPRLIFSKTKYTENSTDPILRDLDGDGSYEIQILLHVPDVGFLSRASQEVVPCILRYDTVSGQYQIANTNFRSFFLNCIQQAKREVRSLRKNETPVTKSSKSQPDFQGIAAPTVLKVVCMYLLLDDRQTAWGYFNKNYNYPDKEQIRRNQLQCWPNCCNLSPEQSK